MSKSNNLTVRKSLRLSEEEDAFLRQQYTSTGLNANQYIRRLLDVAAGKAEMPTDRERYILLKELTQEINYIGHNINQIVKNVNSHFFSYDEKKRLYELLCEVKHLITQCR